MKYVIKCINGEWWACTRTVEPNDRCHYERISDRKKVVDGKIIQVKETTWRTGTYVKVHTFNNDGSPREYVMLSEKRTGSFSDYFAARVDRVFKQAVLLPATAEPLKDQEVTQEVVDRILNPYPEIVLTLATLLQQQGECWKDDCGVIHVDDIDTLGTAEQIYNLLKTNNIDFDKETFVKKDEIVNNHPQEEARADESTPAQENLDTKENLIPFPNIKPNPATVELVRGRRAVRDILGPLDGTYGGVTRDPFVAAVAKKLEASKEVDGVDPFDPDAFDYRRWYNDWGSAPRD